MEKWDRYSRLSLDAAAAATSVGFSAAKAGTKLGVRFLFPIYEFQRVRATDF